MWETLYNFGFIGDPGAWDYTEVTGIGFFPGFAGFTYPNDEELATYGLLLKKVHGTNEDLDLARSDLIARNHNGRLFLRS